MTVRDEAGAARVGLLDPDTGVGVIAEVAELVNLAYAIGEEGLWRDDTTRTTPAETRELVRNGEIAVAWLGERIVGSVRIQRLHGDVGDDGAVGEFGMLATDPAHQGLGIGGRLVRFAERLSRDRGLSTMQLELLTPKTWVHPVKKFLHDWYTSIGYRIVRTGGIEEQYPDLAPLLATPCDFVIYHKALG